MTTTNDLVGLLAAIEAADTDYPARYPLVLRALGLAAELGYPAGIRLDPDEPAWPVVCVEPPTGQVSWHMPAHPIPWDGHTTQEKYRRRRAFRGERP